MDVADHRHLARVRPQRRTAIRFALVLAGGAALTAIAARPLEDVGADAIVRAPNYGRPAPADRLPGEITVNVGAPAITLSLEVVDAREPRGTVFVLHGIRDSKASMRGWGELLARAGYRAVLVDLRGHGRSTGDALTYGVLESADLTQALDQLEARGVARGPIGAMGISYGAATSIEWAGRDARVGAVVAIAPFSSLRDVVPGYLPIPLPDAFVRRTIDRAGERGGFDPDAASPLDAIARTRASVLLVHGTKDARIPASHSERMLAAATGHAELVLVPGAGHESVAADPFTNLVVRAPAFFDKSLSVTCVHAR